MAISVELGPGIRLVAPSRSRNSSSVSHLRRWTISACISPVCAAGPPKAVKPSLRNTLATSRTRSSCELFISAGVWPGGCRLTKPGAMPAKPTTALRCAGARIRDEALLHSQQDLALLPEFFQVIEVALLGREQVNHDIAVVDHDPAVAGISLLAALL